MEDCTKNTKRIAGTVEMEEGSSTSLLPKRTKFTSQKLKESKNNLPSTNIALENDHFSVISPDKTTTSSDFFSTSLCSSNDSLEIVKDSLRFADLEATSFETEVSTCNNNNNKFREASPSSEICGDSEETSMDSPANKPQESRQTILPPPEAAAAKMPSLAEIDAFFSAAEKYEQKRFAEKYNYDIVKDVPLDGRYQWIHLKP